MVASSLFIGAREKERGRERVRPCGRPAVAAPSNKSALLVKSFDFERLCSLEHAVKPFLLVSSRFNRLPLPDFTAGIFSLIFSYRYPRRRMISSVPRSFLRSGSMIGLEF